MLTHHTVGGLTVSAEVRIPEWISQGWHHPVLASSVSTYYLVNLPSPEFLSSQGQNWVLGFEKPCSISDTLAPSLVWEDSSQLMAQPGAWVTLAKQLMAELQQSVSLVECCPLSDGSTPDSWPTSQHRCTGGLVCHQWETFLLSNALFILNIHTFP